MHSAKKALLYGFLVWLVPFAVAIPLYTPAGDPRIDIFLFKSIMMIVGSATGALLLVRYFKDVGGNYVREGAMIGLTWLAMNWVFDFATVMQMSDMTLGAYFSEIGLRYLTIPIFSIAIGKVLEKP